MRVNLQVYKCHSIALESKQCQIISSLVENRKFQLKFHGVDVVAFSVLFSGALCVLQAKGIFNLM